MALSAGTRLGPYEILALLGAGGMGEVYRARDTRLDRTVAIKVLSAQLTANADLKARFEREARAISQLQHPHICTLYDVGHQDGTDFLVMEYLEGETLADRLHKGPPPLAEVLKVGIEIADALDKAHRAGITHRDLKPGNIMLAKAGAKLLDFGLAKPASMATGASGSAPLLSAAATMNTASPQISPLTTQGSIVGTIQYMSPEQIEGKEADPRSDIFAFGAVLYEMITGRRAFAGKSQIKVASAILEDEPQPITALQPTVPPALAHVVKTCLAKDPEERFQTARDLKLELQWIADASSSQLRAPSQVATRRLPWRQLLLGIAVTGWIAAVFALVAIFALRSEIRGSRRPVAAEIGPAGAFLGAVFGAPAFSPDGSKLAFAADTPKGTMLAVRDMATGQMQFLEGTPGAQFIFWSPDSRHLGFFAQGKLRRIPAAGGPVQVLCDAPQGRGGAWSPNGTIIFTPNIRDPLFAVNEAGGKPERLTSPKEGVVHRTPLFLPDGEHFLYVARDLAGGALVGSVYAASLKGGEPKLVLAEGSNVQISRGYLLYYKGGNLVAQKFDAGRIAVEGTPVAVAEGLDYWNLRDVAYFATSADGVLAYRKANPPLEQVLWVNREGKEVAKVGEPGYYDVASLATDGSRVALSRRDPASLRGDIWVMDLKRLTLSRATFADTPQTTLYRTFALSPDGSQLAVSAASTGTHARAWLQSSSGSGPQVTLLESSNWASVHDWSRDGRYIFGSVQDPKTDNDIFYVDLKGDRKMVKFLQSPSAEAQPVFSPNGKWLAYTSNETGRGEVFVTAFPGPGGKWQISNGGGNVPRWSHDGRELYFFGDKGVQVAPILNSERFDFGVPRLLSAELKGLAAFEPGPTLDRFLVLKDAGLTKPRPLQIVTNWLESLNR